MNPLEQAYQEKQIADLAAKERESTRLNDLEFAANRWADGMVDRAEIFMNIMREFGATVNPIVRIEPYTTQTYYNTGATGFRASLVIIVEYNGYKTQANPANSIQDCINDLFSGRDPSYVFENTFL